MKVGLQTIAWHDCDDRIDEPIKAAKDTGYDGIELAQFITEGQNFRNALAMLSGFGLQLCGVSGGSLRDRLALAKQFESELSGRPLPYIYADAWSDLDEHLYLNSNVQANIAIHPHMFKPIQTFSEAKGVKKRCAYVKYMPDTAHSTIAGDDILAFLTNHLAECVAVHVKDWTPEFGRSLPFYSTGFVSLGTGRVPIKEVVMLLKQQKFDGWLIVEQDFASNPTTEAHKSRDYLRALGV